MRTRPRPLPRPQSLPCVVHPSLSYAGLLLSWEGTALSPRSRSRRDKDKHPDVPSRENTVLLLQCLVHRILRWVVLVRHGEFTPVSQVAESRSLLDYPHPLRPKSRLLSGPAVLVSRVPSSWTVGHTRCPWQRFRTTRKRFRCVVCC